VTSLSEEARSAEFSVASLSSFAHSALFLTGLLRLTRNRKVLRIEQFVGHFPIGPNLVEELVWELESKGLVDIRDGVVSIQSRNRLALALELISRGTDPELVSKALAWGEFESLVSKILELCEYSALGHVVVKDGRKRFEIDVVAARKPVILCVDCKHWKRSWLRAAYSEIAKRQVERSRVLGLPDNLRRRVAVDGWKWADLFPVVVTLAATPIVMCGDVPVVSVYKFGSFLREFGSHQQVLKKIHVELGDLDESSRSLWKRA